MLKGDTTHLLGFTIDPSPGDSAGKSGHYYSNWANHFWQCLHFSDKCFCQLMPNTSS